MKDLIECIFLLMIFLIFLAFVLLTPVNVFDGNPVDSSKPKYDYFIGKSIYGLLVLFCVMRSLIMVVRAYKKYKKRKK